MEPKAIESESFTLIPNHLLRFKADDHVKAYYRLFLEINHSKDKSKQSKISRCQSCFAALSINDQPRIKSGQKMTKHISGLLKKSEFSMKKKDRHLIKKYLRSSSQMIVKCRSCDGTTRIPIMTNESKRDYKEKLLMSKYVVKNAPVMDIKKKKKKKRGKKQKLKDVDINCGLRLPSQQEAKNITSTTSVPISPAQYTSDINSFSNTIDSKGSQGIDSKGSQGIDSKGSQGKLNASSKQQQKVLDPKTKKRELSFQSSVNAMKKKQRHTQLKQFLLQETQEKPRASLSDFLSSL
ncbi:unnamed protein product [Lymnaea stagnalis]|uniref:Uncharacterized protein n=1 Tax=Lymnaea stagnalis TaxID=6523 RepID=A0AAV2HJH6_LYMST